MRRTMAFASGPFLVEASPFESNNNTCKITRLYPAQPQRVQKHDKRAPCCGYH